MKRYHIIFKGRVQGVGFRFQVKMLADSLNITGTVKNLYDGSVEVFIQADKITLCKFFEGLENINFARIENKFVEVVDIKPNESEFEIIY